MAKVSMAKIKEIIPILIQLLDAIFVVSGRWVSAITLTADGSTKPPNRKYAKLRNTSVLLKASTRTTLNLHDYLLIYDSPCGKQM